MVLLRMECREGNLHLLSKCFSCLATDGLMQTYKQLLQKTWESDDLLQHKMGQNVIDLQKTQGLKYVLLKILVMIYTHF